jgi:hypothetical protein
MNNIPSAPELVQMYQEQNSEIIRNNIKLNERIAILESIISQLQQENLQLRINNVKKTRHKRSNNKIIKIPTKVKTSKKNVTDSPTTPIPDTTQSTSNIEDNTKETISHSEHTKMSNNASIITTHKRSCSSKPINYSLPSTKSKLRKGDPFTFGNE